MKKNNYGIKREPLQRVILHKTLRKRNFVSVKALGGRIALRCEFSLKFSISSNRCPVQCSSTQERQQNVQYIANLFDNVDL